MAAPCRRGGDCGAFVRLATGEIDAHIAEQHATIGAAIVARLALISFFRSEKTSDCRDQRARRMTQGVIVDNPPAILNGRVAPGVRGERCRQATKNSGKSPADMIKPSGRTIPFCISPSSLRVPPRARGGSYRTGETPGRRGACIAKTFP